MTSNQRPVFYKRKLLIYPKFQLSLIAVNIVTMLTVFGAIEYQILSAVADMNALGDEAALGSKYFYNRFIEYQMSVLYSGLALYLAIGFLLSCFITLIISHRLAGPILRTQKYFEQIEKSGKVEQPLQFRDGDFLKGLPEAVNRGLNSIQANK